MSPLLERVFFDVDELPKADQFTLYRRLRERFDPEAEVDPEDAGAVEAAWDEEIARRVQDIEEGRVELISGEEFERRTDALFKELGIQRQSRLA